MRLDKYLADSGLGTRSEVKKYLKNKWVTVNGETVQRPELKIDPAEDQVSFRGMPVTYEEFSYYVLHKPAGYVTACTDLRDHTVMELLPGSAAKGLAPVGRLDKDTEGLLFITNDGALNHHLTSPSHHVEKTYYVILDRKPLPDAVRRFAEGVDIGDEKPTMPAMLKPLPSDVPMDTAFSGNGAAHAKLTISEGRYHQVKRMFAAIGCEVLYLKRLSLGELSLGDLPRGSYRKLSEEELAKLWGKNE